MPKELHALGDLAPAPYNPRKISPKAASGLAKSLHDFGDLSGVVWNSRTGNIVCGHQRVDQLKKLGGKLVQDGEHAWIETPRGDRFVIRTVDWDEGREKAANVIANNPNIAGDFTDGLNDLLDEIRSSIGELDFTNLALDDLLDKKDRTSINPSDNDAPSVPEEPITKPGDIWELGQHRLVCGDAAMGDVARAMGDLKACCMWTDPPYGVDYVGKTKDALTIKNDGSEGLEKLLTSAFKACDALLEPGAPYYIAHPAGIIALVFGRVVTAVGWRIHQQLVWAKDTMVLGHSDYHYKHEPILYGWTKGEGRSGRGNHEGSRWYGDNKQTSVLEHPKPQRSEEHPTMKPVELVAQCLENSSPFGGVVIDPFLGSGTTLIACERLGRRCYGTELDPRYCDVIVKRWEKATGGQGKKLGG